MLTGNGGADKFEFSVSTSTASAITVAAAPVPVTGNDVEIITVPTNGTVVAGDAQVTINYQVNSTIAALVIDLAGVDLAEDELVTKAIAAALNAVANVDAVAEDVGGTWQVTANGVNGARFDVNGFSVTGADKGALAFTADHSVAPAGDDVVEVATLALAGGANAVGEVYSITAVLAGGPTIISNYVSVAADVGNQATLAGNIAAKFNGLATTQVTATAAVDGSTITFTDVNADNGGFTLSFNSAGAVDGSGASSFSSAIAANFYHSADIVADFGAGDTLDLNLVGGNNTNTVEAAAAANTFAEALASANANFLAATGTVQYYFGWFTAAAGDVEVGKGADLAGAINTGDTVGLLFVDYNKDGSADGLVRLIGVDGAEFNSGSIVA